MATAHPLASFINRGAGGGNLKLDKLPRLADFVGGFGLKEGIRRFDEEVEVWRDKTERHLAQIFAEAMPLGESSLAPVAAQTSTVTTSPTAPAVSPGQVSAIAAQVTALSNSLRIHTEAQSDVHGATGNVVGTSGAQNLNSKNIGETIPGRARFSSIAWSNVVASDQVLVVPADYSLIVAGTFTVNGSIVIEGEFRIIN